ncbi:MAG: hypothetical protein GC192_07460 [Bacteroidetes bacterium]|nr:hypothetical protein [Bacteroidota bacterium]
MKNIGILLLTALLAFTACRKDIDKVTVEETKYVPEILKKWEPVIQNVNGDLTGFVTDELGVPVNAATVKMGNLATTTDEYGHFFFKGVQMNAKGSFVQVEKGGYFPGSRRFFAVKDAENRVEIELMAKNFDQSFDSQAGGTINVTGGGGTIVFPPNSIQLEDGTPYSGMVKVASKYLDPTDPRTLDRMPGNLQGVDLLSEEVVMATYGMIVAELQSDAGEKLNILKGKTATIKTPVPASLLASAPAEIPLWSYFEEYGMWAEEGVSRLENGYYVAEVSHFSYWNHDFKDPLIEFTAVFVDENGNPLVNYKVVVRQPNTSLYGYAYTCELGIINGLIPQNYELVLEVFGQCNELLYSVPIGPFATDVDLGTIVIPASALNSTTLSGNLVDCNGDPIQNGLVVFKFDNQTVFEYTDGTPFEVTFSTCSSSSNIDIVGIDLDALVQSDPMSTGIGGTFDLGDIDVCDVQLQNYIKITVNGVTAVYTVAEASPDSITGTAFSFYSNQQPSQSVYLTITQQAAGTYDAPDNNSYIYDAVNMWQIGGSFPNFEITQYGNTGEPIIGTFGGTVTNNWAQNPTPITVSGEINIIRDF